MAVGKFFFIMALGGQHCSTYIVSTWNLPLKNLSQTFKMLSDIKLLEMDCFTKEQRK